MLLQGPSMFIHLDPRRKNVVVPQQFTGQAQLVLQVGLNMAIPIPDLDIDEEGISCTLSFNHRPFWCRMPWSAVYALVGEDGRGMIWPQSVPPELAVQDGRPKLRAVSSTKPRADREPTAGAGAAARPTPLRDTSEHAGLEAEHDPLAHEHPDPDLVMGTEEQAHGAGPSREPGAETAAESDATGEHKRSLPPYLKVIK